MDGMELKLQSSLSTHWFLTDVLLPSIHTHLTALTSHFARSTYLSSTTVEIKASQFLCTFSRRFLVLKKFSDYKVMLIPLLYDKQTNQSPHKVEQKLQGLIVGTPLLISPS